MPNTTNYSFPTPADTDLVKNGADAIRDLGDAVDTAMNTALGTKKAMGVLLNTTTFSGVSSQSVNDVFSSTYDNYLLLINYTSISGADSNFTFRLRVSGSDAATNYSNWIMGINSGGTANNIVSNSQTANVINQSDSTETLERTTSITLFNPNKANATYGHLQSTGLNQTGSYIGLAGSIAHLTTTAYTGFTLLRDSGTFTGQVQVYGFNK